MENFSVDALNNLGVAEMRLLAEETTTQPILLTVLALHEDPSIARLALKNPNLPMRTIKEVAVYSNSFWRLNALWKNNNIPRELFEIIHCRPNSYITRTSLFPLSHSKCPEEILWQASHSPLARTRAAVASNQNLPHPLIERLATDYSPLVFTQLARNPVTPLHVLERLSSLKLSSVQVALLLRRDGFGRALDKVLVDSRSTRVRISIARMTGDHVVLERLAIDSNPLVREAVADNPQVSESARVSVALLAGKGFPRLSLRVP